MKLENDMLLYHGSYLPIEKINLEKCTQGKDFGCGFYLTSDYNQAHNFIRTSLKKAQKIGIIPQTQNYGYISSFKFHPGKETVKVHIFDNADKEWLWFISQNRRENLSGVLKNRINPDVYNSDIIIGKIANDTTNPVITTYLNGLFGDVQSEEAINFAIRQLMPEHLVDQYCFLTQKAVSCLVFQEAIKYAV